MPPRVNLPVISAISRTIARHHTTGRMEPAISKGADVDALKQRLNPLLSTNGGRWTLTKNGEAMERTFKFKTFTKTWDFMTAVSLQCKIKNHHPEWSNVSRPSHYSRDCRGPLVKCCFDHNITLIFSPY
ncbi:hypothetical protein DL546_007804 [Coniochaeta pulveracea]|uniref:4a-hydroxytetrahydrobiopterin dehydratase n=1 Tax=Coniochaeta pulveracea TaxID=177199 RepID=A0A420YD80_9PEZI|nr:hypothetical protein DL546_007804 [Coniochaeta pulveracea]